MILPTTVRTAFRAISAVLLVASLLVGIGIGLGPHSGKYRVVTVLSDSMQPEFAAGDMIVVTPQRPRDLRRGQVITYRRPTGEHAVITHRVVEVVRGGSRPIVRTKGDASSAVDPWTARLTGDVVWRQRFSIPKVGWGLAYLREPWLRAVMVFGLPALLALVWLAHIWTAYEPRPRPPRVPRTRSIRPEVRPL